MINKIFKIAKRFLYMQDWLWSVILGFSVYWFLGSFLPPSMFGVPLEFYAINLLQPLLGTAAIIAGLFTIARIGLWFNLRKAHRYIWGHKYKEEGYKLFSNEDFKSLKPWQKILFSFGAFLVLFVASLIVFIHLLDLS